MACVSSEVGEDFFLTNINAGVFGSSDEDEEEDSFIVTSFEVEWSAELANLACTSVVLEHVSSSSVGLVGLQVWRGALFLADFLLANPEEVLGKRVLELAAGTGLTSVVASAGAASVTATDVDRGDILPLLRRNCAANVGWSGGDMVQVCQLNFFWEPSDWSLDLTKCVEDSRVILAADVVYDREITVHFFNSLRNILGTGEKTVFIAIERRLWTGDDGTVIAPNFEFFLENLETLEKGRDSDNYTLRVTEEGTDFSQFFKYNRVNELRLWRLVNCMK